MRDYPRAQNKLKRGQKATRTKETPSDTRTD